MKKNYIIPKTTTVVVQLQQMIAESGGAQGTAIKGSASSSNDVLSRRGSDWGDEDFD